mmetsp:Transcript_7230/g.18779  ORF Transcript_7230/g.18779 Transcript_7230/m.18779 type:complete len:212 (-) Transcript_7230:388-1023(-)
MTPISLRQDGGNTPAGYLYKVRWLPAMRMHTRTYVYIYLQISKHLLRVRYQVLCIRHNEVLMGHETGLEKQLPLGGTSFESLQPAFLIGTPCIAYLHLCFSFCFFLRLFWYFCGLLWGRRHLLYRLRPMFQDLRLKHRLYPSSHLSSCLLIACLLRGHPTPYALRPASFQSHKPSLIAVKKSCYLLRRFGHLLNYYFPSSTSISTARLSMV